MQIHAPILTLVMLLGQWEVPNDPKIDNQKFVPARDRGLHVLSMGVVITWRSLGTMRLYGCA